jgi:hypothetical protein
MDDDAFRVEDDGVFFMSFEDFCKSWECMDIARIFEHTNSHGHVKSNWDCTILQGEWKEGADGGVFAESNPTAQLNPQYLLTIDTDETPVFVSVAQKDCRYANDDKEDMVTGGFSVMSVNNDSYLSKYDPYNVVYDSPCITTLEVSFFTL